jgi:hypothetical protein
MWELTTGPLQVYKAHREGKKTMSKARRITREVPKIWETDIRGTFIDS